MRNTRHTVTTEFPCRVDDADATLTLDEAGANVARSQVNWLDVDDIVIGDHTLRFVLPDGSTIDITHLGKGFDECCTTVRRLRGPVRRAALTQSALAPLAEFEAREVRSDGTLAGTTDVLLFPHALTLEPRTGRPTIVPLPLIRDVRREGWTFTLGLRFGDDVVVRGLGPRTDEFAERLAEARGALDAATSAAIAETTGSVTLPVAPDGWALDAPSAGPTWPDLLRTWLSLSRGTCATTLAELADPERIRLGMWTEGGTVRMPFMIIGRGTGSSARVAVEAVDADDRATFIFGTDDIDRLNAALILTAFRREALTLADEDLGRWAVAVRTFEPVQWARSAVVARIAHDDHWEIGIREALDVPAANS